jgi:transcriptional regulator with XRE-family HTH domain
MSTLAELRRMRGTTQVELAGVIGVDQRQISRAEAGGDLLLSSLVRYVEALGGTLQLQADFDGERIALDLDL